MREASAFFDARDMLRQAAARHDIRFDVLVAETAVWAAPKVHSDLVATGAPAWFPNIRRGRTKTERRRTSLDGVIFDDNTYANQAIKRAIGRPPQDFDGFETCHIWEKTCYDERYHTAIANLVLLPRALAGFSDHDPQVAQALKYRAFELYGWYPDEQSAPKRPVDYPSTWRPAEPFSDTVQRALLRRSGAASAETRSRKERQADFAAPTPDGAMPPDERNCVIGHLRLWANKTHQVSHIAVAIVAHHEPHGIDRHTLIKRLAPFSKNPSGAIDSLRRSDGNHYGRALLQSADGRVRIHPAVLDEVKTHDWTIPNPAG